MTYEEFAQLPASEKVTLVTIEANTQYKIIPFAGIAAGIFVKEVPHFVSGVKINGVKLQEVHNLTALAALWGIGQRGFFFDAKEKKLYLQTFGLWPADIETVVTHKFFFSNLPQRLPHDLDNGEVVEWDGRVTNIGSLGQQLDDENTGIVLESSSSLKLINQDGFFDDKFDLLVWENQEVVIHSWSPRIPLSEKKRLFIGVVDSKKFSEDSITLSLKDNVFQLRNNINLNLYSLDDGSITDSMIGKPKRRIYGKVKQLKCVPVDCTLSGYLLTGTISVTEGEVSLEGDGTQFLKELSPSDEIFIVRNGESFKFSIESIESDTEATLSSKPDISFANSEASVSPSTPYRFKNRRWHIAGHKLRAPETTVTEVLSSSRIRLESIEGLYTGDTIEVFNNGLSEDPSRVTIRKIYQDIITLSQDVYPSPEVGQDVKKNPVANVFYGNKRLAAQDSWSVVNTDNGAIVEFSPEAELKATGQRLTKVNLTFTSSSRTISTTSTIDLGTILKPRDWIKKNSEDDSEWYEILEVSPQSITLRTHYMGTTSTAKALYKNVEVINDDSLVTVDCDGMEYNGKHISTASDVVAHILNTDADFDNLNIESFEVAKIDAPYMVSIIFPESVGGSIPTVKEAITKINSSVFGSLYLNDEQEFSFSVYNARKNLDRTRMISDDDLLKWSVTTKQSIVNKVLVNYCPFVDINNGEDASGVVEFNSSFVNNMVGIKKTLERLVCIYDADDATTIAQRLAFNNSLSNSRITVSGNIFLGKYNVNDKIFLNMRRLYKRYGYGHPLKIGIVSGVKVNQDSVDLDLIDFGNIMNRVATIADDNTPSYDDASDVDKMFSGFIVDNRTLTPDVSSEYGLGSNLIG